MKETGKMIYNMVSERKSGQMEVNMKATMSKVRNSAKADMFGQMEALMMATGMIIK